MVDLTKLRSGARSLAESFLGIFPGAVVTSGLRTLQEQAQAMASNVVENKDWIRETYLASPPIDACQAWVDAFYDPIWTADYVASGLLGVLKSYPLDELSHMSWHLTGDAVDFQPVTGPVGDEMIGWLQRLVAKHIADGGSAKLLLKEGGLTRWHVQANPLPDSYAPNVA